MIDITPNTTIFGKRNKAAPFKATLNGHDLTAGASKTDARDKAQAILEENYIAAQGPLVVRLAKDGTVFVARWLSADQMEYWIQHPNGLGSGCLGHCGTSLQRYMDGVVAQYDSVTADPDVTADPETIAEEIGQRWADSRESTDVRCVW